MHDSVPVREVRAISELMSRHFVEGSIDTIEIIYPRFKNTLVQETRLRPMLPLSNLKQFVERLQETGASTEGMLSDDREIVFEPDVHQVLAALLPYYLTRQLHQFILSAKASEHSARMVAMKTAKDNATKLLGDLTLQYNKARQEAITSEILEIAAAQFAN